MSNAGRAWTDADHRRALWMRDDGYSDREIAIELKRTIPAIKGRLKLAWKNGETPTKRPPGRPLIPETFPGADVDADAAHVANCLRHGGFERRELFNGKVIRIWPRQAA